MKINGQCVNILRIYDQATEDEIRRGLVWYRDASSLAFRRMRRYAPRLTKSAACGVVAALSPQKTWSVNLDMADQLVRTGDAGTYKGQVRKACLCLGGENPLNILKGPKERAFYSCLRFPSSSVEVCLDGHAYNIWRGEWESTARLKIPRNAYILAVSDYKRVAELLCIKPHQLQAITWITWRRVNVSKGHVIDKNKGLTQ